MSGPPPDSVAEFAEILEAARSRLRGDPTFHGDVERTARAMTEAYYRGRLERERIDREMGR